MPKYPLDDDLKARKPNGLLGKGYARRIAKNGTLTLGRRDLQKMDLAPGAWALILVFEKKVERGEMKNIQKMMEIRPIKASSKNEEFFKRIEKESKK